MRIVLLLLVIHLLVSSFAEASGPRAPRDMVDGTTGFLRQGLGNSCYVFDLQADTLPCNPAFMARERKRQFNGNLSFGQNVGYIREVQDILNGDANSQTIERLFHRKQSDELEANLDAGFLTENYALAYSPVRISYYTLFRNPALPRITVFASQESSARGQIASYINDNLSWGLQLRYLQRKFVASDFFLTDALAAGPENFFEPREQKILFVEPSLLWSNEDSKWQPSLSASLQNLGVADKNYDEFPVSPQPHVSAGIAPEVGPGRWGLGIDAFYDNRVERSLEPFTVGTYYQFGILKVFGSLAEFSQAAGFQILSGPFSLGLSYSTKTVENILGDRTNFQRFYGLLGVEL